MTGFRTPSRNVSRQFDIDRYLLDGCRDVVAIEIADEAIGPDPDIATGLRCVEWLRPGVEKFLETAAVRQGKVDGHPGRARTFRAAVGLGLTNQTDGGTIGELGTNGPP